LFKINSNEVTILPKITSGQLGENCVSINDPKSASRLYNRGLYGTPISGGGLELELIEAYYLLDEQKIRILDNDHELGLEQLLTYGTKREPTFEIKYIVYRDLRVRGHIVKQSNTSDFVIYGSTGGSETKLTKRKIKYWVWTVSERSKFQIAEVIEQLNTALNTRKDLLIAVVDEEGDLTYYKASTVKLKGHSKQKDPKTAISGSAVLVEDRVMLWEPELISELRKNGFYGKIVGRGLQLALTESAYLLELGTLNIRLARTQRKVSLKQFLKIARKLQPDFDRRLKVYRELKSKNLIVKTGFKYGAHFRVYEGDPESEHSEYLIHGIPMDFNSSWEEMSRAVRLAHGVRKEMVFACISQDLSEINYIDIARIKP
jgi:tRNA-intron endonuclease